MSSEIFLLILWLEQPIRWTHTFNSRQFKLICCRNCMDIFFCDLFNLCHNNPSLKISLNLLQSSAQLPRSFKGQLISKCPYEKSVSSKNTNENISGFLPTGSPKSFQEATTKLQKILGQKFRNNFVGILDETDFS